jgi:hypothetical protein
MLAGAITAGFHTLLLEPLIEHAIQLEEQAQQAHGKAGEEPVVDRPTQRWGLVLGFLVYGAMWGLLFGLLAYFAQSIRPSAWTTARYGFILALLVGWTVALLPFLKYPANPPGVGAAESIGYRQWLYMGSLGLSVIGTAMAVWLGRRLQPSISTASAARRPFTLAVVAYVIYAIVVYAAMPANPDPVEMPTDLLWLFRAVAFAGLILFWILLGGAFGWLAGESVPAGLHGRERA